MRSVIRSLNATPAKRAGFSLLEAILSMVLLASSAAVLFQLAYVGRRHLQDSDQHLTAQLLCQNRLREILCGIEPLEACESTPLESSPGWSVTVDLQPVDGHEGVQLLKVTVAEATESLIEDADSPGVHSFTLSQWVLDLNRDGLDTEVETPSPPTQPEPSTSSAHLQRISPLEEDDE